MQYLASIVVPLDGSLFAEQAIPLATELATAWKSQLHLVTVHQPLGDWNQGVEFPVDTTELERQLRQQEAEVLERLARRISLESDLTVDTAVLDGPVAYAIEEYTARVRADLVVMTSHGRGGLARALLGNTADRLVRRLPMPVLVVRPGRHPAAAGARRRMLVPLDGSALADSVMEQAKTLARATRADLLLAMIETPPPVLLPPFVWPAGLVEESSEIRQRAAETYLEMWRQQLQKEGFDVQVQVRSGRKVAREIIQLARDERCSMIAMATHGAGGLDRMMLGSVTDQVLRHADVPVLVLRPVAAIASPAGEGLAAAGATL